MTEKVFHRLQTLDLKRDAYGFAVRPQHLQRYRDYANIFEEEEEERSNNWKAFLEQQAKLADPCSSEENENETLQIEVSDDISGSSEKVGDGNSTDLCSPEKEDKDISHVEISEQILHTASKREGDVKSASLSALKDKDKERLHVEVIGQMVDSASEKVGETNLADLCSSVEEDKKILQVEDSKQTSRAASQNIGEAGTAGRHSSETDDKEELQADVIDQVFDTTLERIDEKDDPSRKPASNVLSKIHLDKKFQSSKYLKVDKVKKWSNTRPALRAIENTMSFRVKKPKRMEVAQPISSNGELLRVGVARPSTGIYEVGVEPELDVDEVSRENVKSSAQDKSASQRLKPHFPWEEELESLVLGGVPKKLRGELWQAFVGTKKRRKTMERYYQDLLAMDFNSANGQILDESSNAPNQWKKQIEKDIPRTFPGHPALDEHGRNSLRRLLIAYARHNPAVGYCQAMNFFAGLLLLLMPEENAFWTLVGIMDDYFDGYFTEDMIESQVDQLVFEELVRERFPKLVNHLDYLGVQVAWISGPWFLSIFINMLPWESVLRVWDVLLFEGNRLMLFRTALALMEVYGPAIVTTQDAGDAITLLQSLAGSTFDSSQLVLTACMGFMTVTEDKLQELRDKHRPSILNVIDERARASQVWKDSKGLAAKLYSFKHPPGKLEEIKYTGEADMGSYGSHLESPSPRGDNFLSRTGVDGDIDSIPDLQEQVVMLKVELCRVLEEKRFSILRAEELETALMEMVKQDNRLQLSARIEQLEHEIANLQQALNDKKEQEAAMVQVLMRMEQEHKLTEDARASAEQDAAAQRYVVHMLQEKYENAMASLAQMEKRAVMAESMLEATLQSESGQSNASCPRATRNQNSQQAPLKKFTLSQPFTQIGLGWRDRNKAKPTNTDKPSSHEEDESSPFKTTNQEHNHRVQS